jgi:phosphoglycolate phosphatase-like HAD superfamily hydrolase
MKGLLRVANVLDLLEDAASSGDAKRSKPDPDIVKAALAKAECRPTDAIMLGDTPYDVEAALRAGVAIIALECGGWRAHELQGAAQVFTDPAALLRAYDASLFAERAPRAATSG